ncbi:MAG TPA: hypothetical protein VGO52_10350 [Hyphomonadaceae bacterium]|jgi:hypothetical protein|nr:hypothetical protein [Hyphomonadaceae bacterium]
MRWIAVAYGALLAGCATAAPRPIDMGGDASCVIAPADKAFIEGGLAAWAYAEGGIARLKPAERRPHYVLFDGACQYDSLDGATWTAAWHDGKRVRIPLPGGTSEVGPVAFTAPMPDGNSMALVALPSVWRTIPQFEERLGDRLDVFLTSVFVHEMTHTRETWIRAMRSAPWAEVFRREGLSSETVQDRFASNAEFVAGIAREKQLLFEAAETLDRQKARQALEAMRARRAKWFVGDNAKYAEVEDVFLATEGVAVLVQYFWLADPRGAGWTAEQAMKQSRDGSGVWALDEGFALMLAVDRLVPDWRSRVFSEPSATALDLLALAAGET